MDCRSTVGDELDPLDRRSRYRADIDHALRTAVSKPVAIEQRQCGAGPDAPQVEGRCPVDVDVLVLCALPRTDTGVLAAAEILRQAARNLERSACPPLRISSLVTRITGAADGAPEIRLPVTTVSSCAGLLSCSEGRRVGKAGVSTCSSWVSP